MDANWANVVLVADSFNKLQAEYDALFIKHEKDIKRLERIICAHQAAYSDMENVLSSALKDCIAVMDEAGRNAALKELTDAELGKLWVATVDNARAAIAKGPHEPRA